MTTKTIDVIWATHWNAERVLTEIGKTPKGNPRLSGKTQVGKLVGFKVPTNFARNLRMGRAFHRKLKHRPPEPCTATAVHAAVTPSFNIVFRYARVKGWFYIVIIDSAGLSGGDKWYGTSYRIVAKVTLHKEHHQWGYFRIPARNEVLRAAGLLP